MIKKVVSTLITPPLIFVILGSIGALTYDNLLSHFGIERGVAGFTTLMLCIATSVVVIKKIWK